LLFITYIKQQTSLFTSDIYHVSLYNNVIIEYTDRLLSRLLLADHMCYNKKRLRFFLMQP